jgi:hypothetical protein
LQFIDGKAILFQLLAIIAILLQYTVVPGACNNCKGHVFAIIAPKFPVAITQRFPIIATAFPTITITHRFTIITIRFLIIGTHILVQYSTFHSLYPTGSVREKILVRQLCQVSTNICHTQGTLKEI